MVSEQHLSGRGKEGLLRKLWQLEQQLEESWGKRAMEAHTAAC
jgi:hypothetical protein